MGEITDAYYKLQNPEIPFDDYLDHHKSSLIETLQKAHRYEDLTALLKGAHITLDEQYKVEPDLAVPLIAKGFAQCIADLIVEEGIHTDDMILRVFDSARGNGLFFELSFKNPEEPENEETRTWHRYSAQALNADDYLALEDGKITKRKRTYTQENLREAMALYSSKHPGKVPELFSGVIEGPCTLAGDGRTWQSAYQAFVDNRVEGVPEGTTLREFAVGEGFIASTSTYTRENIREAMALYIENNGDGKLRHNSGVIEGPCTLADGKRIWNNVCQAFRYNRVEGVPEGTIMREFVHEEFGANLLRSKKTLNLASTFNSVAWHILKEKALPQADDTPISHGHLLQKNLQISELADYFSENAERSYGDLDKLMRAGIVDNIPKNMALPTFAQHVETRLEAENFKVPTPAEVLEWH